MLKGCPVFLANITTKEMEDKSKKKRLEDVPIVRDFLDVFPENLVGLLWTRQVEFSKRSSSDWLKETHGVSNFIGLPAWQSCDGNCLKAKYEGPMIAVKKGDDQSRGERCMRTRNSNFPNNSNVTIPRRRNRGRAPNVVELELRTIVEVAPTEDCTNGRVLRATPRKGYGEAIVLPEIIWDHFEILNKFVTIGFKLTVSRVLKREKNPHAISLVSEKDYARLYDLKMVPE
ncbi:hypothetical protein Tco_0135206 [Tanacetum coccineum]